MPCGNSPFAGVFELIGEGEDDRGVIQDVFGVMPPSCGATGPTHGITSKPPALPISVFTGRNSLSRLITQDRLGWSRNRLRSNWGDKLSQELGPIRMVVSLPAQGAGSDPGAIVRRSKDLGKAWGSQENLGRRWGDVSWDTLTAIPGHQRLVGDMGTLKASSATGTKVSWEDILDLAGLDRGCQGPPEDTGT